MVEKIIEFCARNRVLVLLAVAAATALSVFAIQRVKLDAIPDLSDPQVIVYTEWMGRSPTLIEDQVTYPIVSALVSAPHVADVRGYSMFGMSFVYVIFEEGTDVYWARSRVLEYLSTLQARLPGGVTPALGPDATGIGWVFQYTLVDKSGRRGLDELRTFQDFTLRYALGSVPGVAEVASVGGYQKQYQVTVDPNTLRAYGLTLDEVVSKIRASNSEVGGRVVEMSGREYYVRGRGYVQDIGDLEKVALRSSGPNGVPVLVGDVAQVRFGPDIRRGLLEWNGEGEAVGGIVVMRYGENALTVIERVKEKLAELQAGLPEGVTVEVAYDRSDLIHRSIGTLQAALLEEAIVVALIIILFLLHFRSALLPILSLPVAVAVSFIPMWLLDIPATIMSLGGIAIAIGATVDAEIVMIEASHKKLEHAPPGADRHKLLAEAAREVTPAIFFSLLIIAVAFLPVFTLTGQAGRLFTPLAWTKTFVMLSAAVLSITFAPALRDLLIRGRIRPEAQHPVSRAIIRVYKPFVFVALRRPKSTILIGLLALLSAVPLALKLGSEFMPPLNEGDLLYMPTTFPGISIEEAKRQLQLQDRVLRGVPEVLTVFGKVGRAETATDPAPLTMVETTVRLRPKEEWRTISHPRWWSSWVPGFLAPPFRLLWPEEKRMTWEQLVAELNSKMQFPGWTNAYTMPIKGRVDMLSTGVRTPVGVKVLGTSLGEIETIGVALEGLLRPLRGTRSAYYERNTGGLYLDIIPDRDAIARYGLTVGDLNRIIEAAIGGTPISVAVDGRNRFTVNVRYPQDLRSDLDRLRRVLVPVGAKAGGGGGGGMGGTTGSLEGARLPELRLAQMGGGGTATQSLQPGQSGTATDAPALGWFESTRGGPGLPSLSGPGQEAKAAGGSFVPLGQLAELRIVGGPPMIRDDGGLLVGYVYVDIDTGSRDVGGYVEEAKEVVRRAQADGRITMPTGYFLKWTGQYELMEKMAERMRLVIPLTLLLIMLLLWLHFRNFTEVLIVLLSIPFALVGSVWLLWALDYHLSTAVWVGLIALTGLAAQTGIVMIVYIDNAYERRRAAGKIRDLSDIIWAHMEGTVMRVRPKLMTVATMLAGLIPLLWATGSGADVMKRIAAPMVGGLLTSAFLTLEIIPVIYTYWRQEQVLWDRLAGLDAALLARLERWALVQKSGWIGLTAAGVAAFYVPAPAWVFWLAAAAALLAAVLGSLRYLGLRPAAKHLVWPEADQPGQAA
ncbi:MAG: efflux RND transporter permease subunit [Anaeromyxobacter sp.]|nr:efflux RND transporter permease subunit [Anaeromyxobacter sp.]MBL0274977.1 efflux RND transporter permease subunit [Anaeromyxobacter sp.]